MKKESNTIVLNTTKKTRRRNNTTHYERLIALLQLIIFSQAAREGKDTKGHTSLARWYYMSTSVAVANSAKIQE